MVEERQKRFSAGLGYTTAGFDLLSSGGARTTAADSQPFPLGAGSSDKQPFAVSQVSDELLYQNRLSALVQAKTPEEEKLRRNSKSVSGY